MADINSVIVNGRLTRDAETKYTNTGTAILKFSIANNYRTKHGDEWTDEVNYFDVTMFGKRAESLQQYMSKGKAVSVVGELRQNRWEQDGQSRSKIEILARDIQMHGNGQQRDYDDDIGF